MLNSCEYASEGECTNATAEVQQEKSSGNKEKGTLRVGDGRPKVNAMAYSRGLPLNPSEFLLKPFYTQIGLILFQFRLGSRTVGTCWQSKTLTFDSEKANCVTSAFLVAVYRQATDFAHKS